MYYFEDKEDCWNSSIVYFDDLVDLLWYLCGVLYSEDVIERGFTEAWESFERLDIEDLKDFCRRHKDFEHARIGSLEDGNMSKEDKTKVRALINASAERRRNKERREALAELLKIRENLAKAEERFARMQVSAEDNEKMMQEILAEQGKEAEEKGEE